MELKDFLAKLSDETLAKVKIYDNKIQIPVEVNSQDFYQLFSSNINVNGLTAEKAIYVASLVEKKKYLSTKDLLNVRLKHV